MASGIHNRFKANLMNKLVDLVNDVVKCMLLTSTHSFNPDHNVKADIVANEISGTGYTAGGQALANKSVTQDNTNDLAKFDADDVVWSDATFTAHYAVLYDDTLANDDLICCFDFGENKSVSSASFTIQWDANGIIKLS